MQKTREKFLVLNNYATILFCIATVIFIIAIVGILTGATSSCWFSVWLNALYVPPVLLIVSLILSIKSFKTTKNAKSRNLIIFNIAMLLPTCIIPIVAFWV